MSDETQTIEADTADKAKTIAITSLRTSNESGAITVFGDSGTFGLAQRMASLLASSTLVPEPYQRYVFNKDDKAWVESPNAIGNCVIALELATRLRLSPLMVMQNVDMVKGRPGFRGAFVTALVNASPRFSRIDYEWKGEEGGTKGRACRAYATEVETGKVLYGTWIDWKMVEKESWDRNSKWFSMTDQMFMYRAASFWVRVYAPDLLLGMQTREELEDVHGTDDKESSLHALNERLNKQLDPPEAAGEAPEPEPEADKKPDTTRRRRRSSATAREPLAQAAPAPQPAPDPAPAPEAPQHTPAPAPAAPAPAGDMFNVE